MNEIKNYGLNLELEKQQQQKEDWLAGAASPKCIAEIPESERDSFLPVGEIQRGREDFMDCSARADDNIAEEKFTWLYKNDKPILSKKDKKFLEKNNYLNSDGQVEFSDRFVAILSGTTRRGNSLKAPLEAIRKFGLIPKSMLPANSSMTFDEYHNQSAITREMKDLGQEFLKHFSINYERVYQKQFDEFLSRDMLILAGHAWPRPINGEYPRTELPFNHAFVGYKRPKFFIFDNYLDRNIPGDFVKKLAPNYRFFDYGYRLILRLPEEQEIIKKWYECGPFGKFGQLFRLFCGRRD